MSAFINKNACVLVCMQNECKVHNFMYTKIIIMNQMLIANNLLNFVELEVAIIEEALASAFFSNIQEVFYNTVMIRPCQTNSCSRSTEHQGNEVGSVEN